MLLRELLESKLLNKKTPTVHELAEKYHTSILAVEIQLKKGIKVEKEHTNKTRVAKEIALDHLGEDLYYYEKLSKVEKDVNEYQWSDYEHIPSMKDRLDIAEVYFTKGHNLLESNDQPNVDYFLKLNSMSDQPVKNKEYIFILLALVNNKIVELQKSEIGTLLGIKNNVYYIKTSDGKTVKFPSEDVRNNMISKTFLFKNKKKFDKFRSLISLKFDSNVNECAGDDECSCGCHENFADGKKPGRKGLAKRSGVPTKASVSKLRSIAKHSTGEKARMAHWMANMKSGKKKAKESVAEGLTHKDPVERWIKVFKSSTHPKFAGKSLEHREKMARMAQYRAVQNKKLVPQKT